VYDYLLPRGYRAEGEYLVIGDWPVQFLPPAGPLEEEAIAEAMGATVSSAEELMHGKTSQVKHDGSLVFANVPDGFRATRYHSLAVVDSTVPEDLTVTARTAGGIIMAVQHKTKPIYGVQFHPESVLTESGYQMLGNWLESVGLKGAAEKAKSLSPMVKF
jgi:para-aminobenzoate synthetase component 2